MYLVLIPHCMTEILAKECKSGKSTVLALGTVPRPNLERTFSVPRPYLERTFSVPRPYLERTSTELRAYLQRIYLDRTSSVPRQDHHRASKQSGCGTFSSSGVRALRSFLGTPFSPSGSYKLQCSARAAVLHRRVTVDLRPVDCDPRSHVLSHLVFSSGSRRSIPTSIA